MKKLSIRVSVNYIRTLRLRSGYNKMDTERSRSDFYMKELITFLILLTLFSCQEKTENYSVVILENDSINSEFLKAINKPEKAMISWYLFSFGNECDESSSKVKCQLLQELKIEDECDSAHLDNLLQWFSKDMLAVYKLRSCPNIAKESPIQNTFEFISLQRKADTLSITYTVKGINSVQEKSWNTTRTEAYLIRNKTFLKIEINE